MVANGSVTLNADGTLTFTPDSNFNGTASFEYSAGAALHYQFFDRDFQSAFRSVAQIPIAGGVAGSATDFDVGALALSLSGRRHVRHTLHRHDQCRDRWQLYVLHHLG